MNGILVVQKNRDTNELSIHLGHEELIIDLKLIDDNIITEIQCRKGIKIKFHPKR
jgi:hypothetical protein